MKLHRVAILLVSVALLCELADCRGRGGGGRGGGRSGGWGGSRSRSSWFGGSSKKSSSYPKQQWGTSSRSKTAVGGGGFVKPKTGYGSYGARSGGFRSAPQYSYRTPGYGTNYGTSFPNGMGRYGVGPGFSRKSVGLGVGAGFLGGAALGAAASVATLSVYHRYQMYKQLQYMHMYGMYNDPYYNNYYRRGQCYGGCPYNAHCEYGFCECNAGFEKSYGQCTRVGMAREPRSPYFDPFMPCTTSSECTQIDINLVCNTTNADAPTKCQCRPDFKWNEQVGECQFYLDVDCSSITYDDKPSPVVLQAVNTTLDKVKEENSTTAASIPANGTITPEQSLHNSLLAGIDPKAASETEIKEAFCRDVDSFSWEFNTAKNPYDEKNSTDYVSYIIAALAIIVVVIILARSSYIRRMCDRNRNARQDNSKAGNEDEGPNANMELISNPGFKAQETPMHSLPYSVNPPGEPAPIPPTQPGYTNYPPDTSQPYPTPVPVPSLPGTSDPAGPGYPPASGPGYPPVGGPGYPPAYQPVPGPGYPPASGPGYPPASGPGYPPASGPGYPPAPGPGYAPASGPGYAPASGPGYPPASGPGYPPASGPGYPQSDPTARQPPTNPSAPPSGTPPRDPPPYPAN